MKKIFLFFALLSGIAVMTSCQKDQEVVTLKAVIDQETKAYFGANHTHTAWWDDYDEVYIAGQSQQGLLSDSYSFSSYNETYATIVDVPACSVYCAIFPASAVHTMGTPTAAQTKATIKFPSEQKYILDGNRQRLEMPMGAVATPNANGNTTLQFKNLCSILRVNVKNLLAGNTDNPTPSFDLRRITVNAYGAYLAGKADVKLSETGDPTISMGALDSEHNNVLTFCADGYASLGHFDNSTVKSFDIVVPPFDAYYLVLELEVYTPGTNGSAGTILGYSSHIIGNQNSTTPTVHLERNKIVPIDLDVKNVNLMQPNYAYLEKGTLFNQHMLDLMEIAQAPITDIMFNRATGGVDNLPDDAIEVQDRTSPYKIYAYISGTDIIINSYAPIIYANSDCSHMYEDLTTLQSVHWNNDPTEGDGGLQTEDVTNMSCMFKGCTNLTTFSGIEYFNTTNVTDMSSMFEGCTALNGWGLDLSNFNTHNLENMEAMFKGCSSLAVLFSCRDIVPPYNLNNNAFTTERVTNMKDLFNGCTSLANIYIDNFVVSEGTNLSGAFINVGPSWYGSTYNIYCSDDVEDILSSQPATVIDLGKARFPNQTSSSK